MTSYDEGSRPTTKNNVAQPYERMHPYEEENKKVPYRELLEKCKDCHFRASDSCGGARKESDCVLRRPLNFGLTL